MMLKRIMNVSETLTHRTLKEICDKYEAAAHPKVRLADVFSIEGSGISNAQYSYALMSHFDVIVVDAGGVPLFAVEFDGVLHQTGTQMDRDQKKDDLCRVFGLPLLRITSEHLKNYHEKMNLLSWFIEVWFAAQWFHKAKEEGQFDYYEPFMPMSFMSVPGRDEKFPLWLSRHARGEIAKLNHINRIIDMAPSCLVWIDKHGQYYSVAWIVIDEGTAAVVETQMHDQNFPATIHELIEDISVIHLFEKLSNLLNGNKEQQVVPELVNQLITLKKDCYGSPISGGSFSGERIKL